MHRPDICNSKVKDLVAYFTKRYAAPLKWFEEEQRFRRVKIGTVQLSVLDFEGKVLVTQSYDVKEEDLI